MKPVYIAIAAIVLAAAIIGYARYASLESGQPNASSTPASSAPIVTEPPPTSSSTTGAEKPPYVYHRQTCWGNPPQDYMELRRQEDTTIANLRKTYTVTVIECSSKIQ